MLLSDYSEIGQAKKILSLANLKNKIRDMYYAREDAKREKASWEAYKKNVVKNLIEKETKKVFEQGSHAKAIETARNFLRMGLSKEQVAEGTGLSLEEIDNIK